MQFDYVVTKNTEVTWGTQYEAYNQDLAYVHMYNLLIGNIL